MATALTTATTTTLDFYRDLHAHPELSGAEARTADRFAGWLRRAGVDTTTSVGGHGVVGRLVNGAGPTVLLRAELDALPITEDTGLSYRSRTAPVMHACGHDLHLAALAGAASALAETLPSWRGTLLVVGQPAEETLEGAAAMLDDGLYERFGRPDVALAQHTAPLLAGMVAHGHGPMLAGSVSMRVTIHGQGGHAATPHLCVDPVAVAASTIVALHTVVSRQIGPAEQAVLNVGQIHAGTHANVIADQASMDITLRAISTATLDRMTACVERIVRSQSYAAGCPIDPDIEVLSRSPVNLPDPGINTVVHEAHERAFGRDRLAWWPPSLATEDFPRFGADGVPTGYWMLGTIGPRQWAGAAGRDAAEKLAALPGNHSARFAPHAALALPTGVRAMVTAAVALFDKLS